MTRLRILAMAAAALLMLAPDAMARGGGAARVACAGQRLEGWLVAVRVRQRARNLAWLPGRPEASRKGLPIAMG